MHENNVQDKSIVSQQKLLNFYAGYCSPLVFYIWAKDKSTTYRQAVEKFFKEHGKSINKRETEAFAVSCMCAHEYSTIKEIFCLIQNSMKNMNVNLEHEQFAKNIGEIKSRSIVSGNKEMSNYEFVKIIRNAFAHNNENDKSPVLTVCMDRKSKSWHFNIKSSDGQTQIKTTGGDLYSIFGSILYAITGVREDIIVHGKRLNNALVGGYFDIEKINRYFEYAPNSAERKEVLLDEFQKKTILNYLAQGKPIGNYYVWNAHNLNGRNIPVAISTPELVGLVFPTVSNSERLAIQKFTLLQSFYTPLRTSLDLSMLDIVKHSIREKDTGIAIQNALFTNIGYLDFLLITTAMHNVFSSNEIDDLEPLLVEKFEEGQLKHVRNALQHGTYYYNFDGGFEVYDGQRKRKHFTTVRNDDASIVFGVCGNRWGKDNIPNFYQEENE